jgi:hypothetical protein
MFFINFGSNANKNFLIALALGSKVNKYFFNVHVATNSCAESVINA